MHGTDKHTKGFNTWSQLVSMIFCQFADYTSLREISSGLHSNNSNLNHLYILCTPFMSNIAYQKEKRSCAFFRECYYKLLNYFRQHVRFSRHKFHFKNTVDIHIWTALIIILLFAVLKQQATYKWHFSNIVSSLRLSTFTKIDLYQ